MFHKAFYWYENIDLTKWKKNVYSKIQIENITIIIHKIYYIIEYIIYIYIYNFMSLCWYKKKIW